MGWMTGVHFPLHYVQSGSGAHPASCPVGSEAVFPGSKAAWVWSWPLSTI